MKSKFLKLNNFVIVGVMSLLGLTACKKDPEIRPMYGVITTKYCERVTSGETMPTLGETENSLSDENQIFETEKLAAD